MEFLPGFDLLSVGIAVVISVVTGFIVFFNNRSSSTHKAFLFFALMNAAWGSLNYLNYQFNSALIVLWLIRSSMFFAVWHAFSFFNLMYVFPQELVAVTKKFVFILGIVFIVSLLTLTPFVFKGINQAPIGQVSQPVPAPGIFIFSVVVASLIIAGAVTLIRKTRSVTEEIKNQFRFMLAGTVIMFLFIIVFILILPAYFNNVSFIPLGALYTFPFFILGGYAIVKYRLLNIRVFATELFVFLMLSIAVFAIVQVTNVEALFTRLIIFIGLLIFGILLIKSIIAESKHQERLEALSKELAAANEKLKELDHQKDEFLSMASHQIKSPITAMKGYAELVEKGSYGAVPDEVKKITQKMRISARRLINLIDSLLDLRRIEAGKMSFDFANTDIVTMLNELVEEFKPLALEKHLDFSFKPDLPSVIVKADSQKLRQVFQNLIDNAIKYTESGFVKITLEPKQDHIKLCVSDSGIGVAPNLLPNLFQEFVTTNGSGFGLYVARKIVEAHNGKIWAESEGNGKGSNFFVSLSKNL